jgi:single-strand DNA-binding protein
MQQITIAGRIGQDAKVATTQRGDTVANFSVAVDYRDGDSKLTHWWRVSLWGKRAEALGKYLLKGTSVTVSGEFGLTEYEGKPQLNVRANEIALQGGRSEQRTPDGSQGSPPDQGDDLDDQIPFLTSNSVF